MKADSSHRYYRTQVIKDVLREIEAYITIYLGGQDIPVNHDAVVDLAEAIVTLDDADQHMNRARKIFGAIRGDAHYRRIMHRILASPALAAALAAARQAPAAIEPTTTAFHPPAITEKDLTRAESLESYLKLLNMDLTVDGRLMDRKSTDALKSAIRRLFDFGESGADMEAVPPPLRDKLKGMLMDDVRSKAEFERALIRIGPVAAEHGAGTPDRCIAVFSELMADGGELRRLPADHGIRAKALQLLMEAGGRLSMRDGQAVIAFKNRTVADTDDPFADGG